MNEIREAERIVHAVAEGTSDGIPAARVSAWMGSAEIEVQGIAYAVLVSPALLRHVSEGISREAWFAFSVGYLRRCLIDDTGGEWALTGYEAAHDIARAYRSNSGGDNASRRALLRNVLEEAVFLQDEGLTRRVCHGAVEHLLDTPWIKAEFSAWPADPRLQPVYAEAAAYSA